MRWMETAINTAHEGIDLLGDALAESGIEVFTIEDEADFLEYVERDKPFWQEVDEELAASMRGVCRILVYLPDSAEGREVLAGLGGVFESLREQWPLLDFGPLTIETVYTDEEDWMSAWKRFYKPFKVGRKLLVRPEWEEAENEEGRIVFISNPGMAFGSGDHASTRLCLEAVEETVRGGEAVLDIGCGSGILAVSAVLLGAASAFGVDIDPYAAQTAAKNAALNRAADRCEFIAGNMLDGGFAPPVPEGGYDLVLANIVADVIIPLSPKARRVLRPGGTYIVSGVVDGRAGEVRAALAACGFALREEKRDSGWCCFVFSA